MFDSVDTTVDTTSSRASASSVPFPRQEGPHQQGPVQQDHAWRVPCRGIHHPLVLVAIIAYVVINGCRISRSTLSSVGPRASTPRAEFGPTIVSTVYVTALAMLICTPMAVLAAVYLAEYAKQGKVVELIRYAADALASVPLHRYGPVWLRLVLSGHGPGAFRWSLPLWHSRS